MGNTVRTLVQGIGINDADYITKPKHGIHCHIFQTWGAMLKRCYGSPNPKGYTICDDWIYFSHFRAWMVQHDFDGKEFDATICGQGKHVFSPDTCCFVDGNIRRILTQASTGKYATGVHRNKLGKYIAECSIANKNKYIGSYDSEYDASLAYREFKARYIYDIATSQIPRVRDGLHWHMNQLLDEA